VVTGTQVMNVWAIKNDLLGKVAMLVATDEDGHSREFWAHFEGDGSPLHWTSRPKLAVFIDKRSKKPKPRADISPFTGDGLMINGKARDALGDFLSQFGQLLEVDVEGQVEYYYNITNVIHCVDQVHSVKRIDGTIAKPAFIDASIPKEASIFIDPSTVMDIYVNDAGKAELERRIKQAGIKGMSFERMWGQA
jgi:hypothetical protein